MYSALDVLAILSLIYVNHGKDKKAVKKLILKLVKRTQPAVKSAIIDQILAGESLAKFVDRQIEIADLAQSCVEAGGEGMAIVGKDAYPVMISYETEEDRQWAALNEAEIALASAHATMNTLNLVHLDCSIILFRHVGYSGSMHNLEIEPGVVNKFSRRIGNSQYFR